jgi:fibronectin-binding autotransporter adhesin
MNRRQIHSSSPVLRVCALAAAFSTAAWTGLAAESTWTGLGANNNWTTPANWDATPSAGGSLVFDGGNRLTPLNDFSAGTVFRNINFGPGAGAFTLGGNGVTIPAPATINYTGGLNATYSEGSISNSSFSVQTINMPLTLANGHHYIIGNAGGASLSLSAALMRGSAASASFSTEVNVTGTGLANVNGILGGWATMEPPTSWAALDGSGNVVAYTDFTEISPGDAIVSAPASNLRLSGNGTANTLAADVVTDINSLLFSTASGNQVVDVAAGRILRVGSKGGIFNATRTIGGTSRILTIGTGAGVGFVTAGGVNDAPGDLYLIETPFIGSTGNQLVMNSRITNNGAGPVTVHLFGHVSFPNVSHTYSGGTYIHGGRVQTQPFILGTGPIHIFPGGQLFFNANGTCTNDIFMAGFGNAESSGNGAIRMNGGGRIITGTITLTANASTANGTFNGRITGPGGLIVGSGTGNGVGTMTIGATNDYSGDTTINGNVELTGVNATGASTLQMTAGRPHLMPHGAGKGNLILNGANVVATFNLNATDQTINGLSSIGAVANAIITSSTAGEATLTLGDGNASGSYGGTIQNGNGTVALTKIGSGTQVLSGVSTYTGGTVVEGGTLAFGSGAFPAGTSAVTVNNGTMNLSGVTPVTLGAGQPLSLNNGTLVVGLPEVGNAITTATLNANGATNFITIAEIPAISAFPAQITVIKYTDLGGALNFGLAGPLPVSPGAAYAGFISNNVANGSVDFVVTAGPTSIKWAGYSGGAPNSNWDTSTPNWRLNNGGATVYANGAFVRFDDSASNSLVTLNETVSPAGITISNSALSYTLNGGGALTGSSGVSKSGSGTMILANSGFNDFSGDVTIAAGTLQIGNNDFAGNLPADVNILNNGTLSFRRLDEVTLANIISGTGSVSQNSSGSLVLNAANSFTGAANVLQGTLRLGDSAALGTTNGATIISSGATLDIGANAINIGQESVTISGHGVDGNGALINSSGSPTFVGPNLARLTLAADATVGGSGRMDLRSNPTSNPGLGSLLTGGQPRKLIKTGANSFGIIGVTVDAALGDVEIRQGLLGLQDAITGLGNPASNLVIFPGGTLQMFAVTNHLDKVITIGSDGGTPSVSATSGNGNTIVGPMAITNDSTFNVGGVAVSLNLDNVITGPGGITKIGAGHLILSGNSPAYTGGISVQAGSVTVNGTLNTSSGVSVLVGKFTLNGTMSGGAGMDANFGSTVAGSGASTGPADLSGDVFPGDTNVVGTLTTASMVLQSSATLFFDLASSTTAGGGINDLIVVNGDLTVNGNMININPLGLLQTGAGNPYRLFTYTGNLIWNADLVVSGPDNYTFTINTNTPGEVRLVASGGPPVWNGGSPTASNWTDPANWGGVTIGFGDTLYFAGNNRLNNTNDTPADTTYTDIAFNTGAGAFVLNGNPVTLAGSIINQSANTQTVNLGLNVEGARSLDGADGTLIIGGGVTNTANLSTLTLSGSGILTNLLGSADPNSMTNILSVSSNANWTLMDNASSTPISIPVQFDILGGTFNFGQGASAPELASTATIQNSRIGVLANEPGTLNMVNGTLTIAARLNTGSGANTIAEINQSGGTINVLGLLQSSDGSSTAATTIDVTGGTLNVGTPDAGQNFFLASRGTGVVTVASSGAINCAVLDISRNAAGNTLGSVGVVNLNGGTLAVTRVGAATSAAQAGGSPTATFNFNGGTLRARASSSTFFQGNSASPALPITAIVKAGGAVIDSGAFNVTVLEPLLHDSTLGVNPDGGLTKAGSGILTLTGSSTYTGNTLVNEGTLAVNGSISPSSVIVANTGTLAGAGTAGKSVVVNSGGTVSPAGANTIGTLIVAGNVTLNAGSTTFMELNKTAATSDQIRATAASATTITYGGTLSLANISGTLTGSETFKLFSATNYMGSFDAVEPAVAAPGIAWDTSTLNTDGTLRLIAGVNTNPTNITFTVVGNQLNLAWPEDHIGWRLQAQTNALATGLGNNWVDVPGSTAVDNVSIPISSANGAVFFRLIYP